MVPEARHQHGIETVIITLWLLSGAAGHLALCHKKGWLQDADAIIMTVIGAILGPIMVVAALAELSKK